MHKKNHHTPRNHQRIVILALLVVVAMFGFGYLMVPLYNALCQSLGINGKVALVKTQNDTQIDRSRNITVIFDANVNNHLPWSFRPEIHKITIHPGENAHVAYYAKNQTDHAMTIQAIPSVTPGLAASHLKKTQCFCFTHQHFKAHEARVMPLLFHLDRTFPKDIQEITLSYTLFAIKQHKKKP